MNDDQPWLVERCSGLVGNQPPLYDKGAVMRQVERSERAWTNSRYDVNLQNKSGHAAAAHTAMGDGGHTVACKNEQKYNAVNLNLLCYPHLRTIYNNVRSNYICGVIYTVNVFCYLSSTSLFIKRDCWTLLVPYFYIVVLRRFFKLKI